MLNETVENTQSNGPFGAKGAARLATFGVSPAIANAVEDAIGVRLTELPLTPEAVLRAIRMKPRPPAGGRVMSAPRRIAFTLNGDSVTADVMPHHSLVETLQTQFGLTGARESCGQGLCGCCTVLVYGKPVSGCFYLAVFVDGAELVTVEHLGSPPALVPVQQAFIEAGAFQCGYCTPGFVLMTKALLTPQSRSDDEAIQGPSFRQSLPLRRLSRRSSRRCGSPHARPRRPRSARPPISQP